MATGLAKHKPCSGLKTTFLNVPVSELKPCVANSAPTHPGKAIPESVLFLFHSCWAFPGFSPLDSHGAG